MATYASFDERKEIMERMIAEGYNKSDLFTDYETETFRRIRERLVVHVQDPIERIKWEKYGQFPLMSYTMLADKIGKRNPRQLGEPLGWLCLACKKIKCKGIDCKDSDCDIIRCPKVESAYLPALVVNKRTLTSASDFFLAIPPRSRQKLAPKVQERELREQVRVMDMPPSEWYKLFDINLPDLLPHALPNRIVRSDRNRRLRQSQQ